MSSAGNLAVGEYTAAVLEMARANKDFVVGFIAMGRIEEKYPAPLPRDLAKATNRGELVLECSLSPDPEDWLVLTPGVGLDVKGDGFGQQYRTPHEVVFESGCDVIIVGRGIYGKGDDIEAMSRLAERYREEGWKAYLARIRQQ
jgi:orotidine-5'-phosphate decarboxylase